VSKIPNKSKKKTAVSQSVVDNANLSGLNSELPLRKAQSQDLNHSYKKRIYSELNRISSTHSDLQEMLLELNLKSKFYEFQKSIISAIENIYLSEKESNSDINVIKQKIIDLGDKNPDLWKLDLNKNKRIRQRISLIIRQETVQEIKEINMESLKNLCLNREPIFLSHKHIDINDLSYTEVLVNVDKEKLRQIFNIYNNLYNDLVAIVDKKDNKENKTDSNSIIKEAIGLGLIEKVEKKIDDIQLELSGESKNTLQEEIEIIVERLPLDDSEYKEIEKIEEKLNLFAKDLFAKEANQGILNRSMFIEGDSQHMTITEEIKLNKSLRTEEEEELIVQIENDEETLIELFKDGLLDNEKGKEKLNQSVIIEKRPNDLIVTTKVNIRNNKTRQNDEENIITVEEPVEEKKQVVENQPIIIGSQPANNNTVNNGANDINNNSNILATTMAVAPMVGVVGAPIMLKNKNKDESKKGNTIKKSNSLPLKKKSKIK